MIRNYEVFYWIPAYAGMTEQGEKGMTEQGEKGMTEQGEKGMTERGEKGMTMSIKIAEVSK